MIKKKIEAGYIFVISIQRREPTADTSWEHLENIEYCTDFETMKFFYQKWCKKYKFIQKVYPGKKKGKLIKKHFTTHCESHEEYFFNEDNNLMIACTQQSLVTVK